MKFFSIVTVALSAAFAAAAPAPAEAEAKLVSRQDCATCVSGQQMCCDGTQCTIRSC